MHYDNFISGSENSYSSTYNSSSRTRLFGENSIKNHPLLFNKENNNNNILLNTDTILKKFENNRVNRVHYLKDNHNHKRTFTQSQNSLSANNFLLTKKDDNEKKRKNFHLLSEKINEHSTSEKTFTFLSNNNNNKYFHSRNNSNYNAPVKVLTYDNNDNNINYLYKKSTFNLSNGLKQLKLSLNLDKRNSMDELLEKSNINEFRKNKKSLSQKNIVKSSNNLSIKHFKYFNLSSESEMNYKKDYKTIFKRKKQREPKKKTKYNKQLSKISESESGTNNKSFSTNSIYLLTKSSNEFTNDNVENEKNPQRRSYDFNRITRKENSSKFNLSKFSKNGKKLEFEKQSEKKPYLIIQDSLLDDNNEIQFQNIINNFNIKSKNKTNNFLQFFEEDIEDELNIILERNFHSKNYLFNNLMEGFSKKYLIKKLNYLKEIQSHLLIQSHHDRKNDLQNINFNQKFVNYLILKNSKKRCFNYKYYDISLLSTEFLFNNYFEINLSTKFFKEKYFHYENDKTKYTSSLTLTLIDNFKIEKKEKKNKSYKYLNSPKRIIKKNYLSKKNTYYMLYFYQIDYEYYIFPHKSQVHIKDIKLKIKNDTTEIFKSPSSIIKYKSYLKRLSKQFSLKIDSPIYEKKKDKYFLKNALKNNNFFKRKKIIHSKSKILREKSLNLQTFKNQNERIMLEKKHCRIEGHNKLRMISRANDLKQEMLNQLNSKKEKIIFYIKDRNYPSFVSEFEKYKISPDMEDSNGVSLLSIAVQSNSFQIVNYLLNVGANPNIRDNNNNTPLHFALTFHNYEIADMLIQRGADEKVINKMGITPWQCLDSGYSII